MYVLRHGSSKELASKNYYACPKVWCPKSRVALTPEDFKKFGNKCPSAPGVVEEPYVYTKNRQMFFEGDPRTIGILKAPHPQDDSLKIPCCNKKPLDTKVVEHENKNVYVIKIKRLMTLKKSKAMTNISCATVHCLQEGMGSCQLTLVCSLATRFVVEMRDVKES